MGVNEKLTLLSEQETFMFLTEGLRQASSAALQLGDAQKNAIWTDISSLLDELHNNAVHLHRSKPLSRSTVLNMLDVRQKRSSDTLEQQRPQKPRFIMN